MTSFWWGAYGVTKKDVSLRHGGVPAWAAPGAARTRTTAAAVPTMARIRPPGTL
ncbi:hypothetical protein GCM10023334_078880 [Nonomuraea thailandensis]